MPDLKFVLHHVKGVVGEVDFLDAVDELLLRLGINGLLPKLPQFLLRGAGRKERHVNKDKKRERIASSMKSL